MSRIAPLLLLAFAWPVQAQTTHYVDTAGHCDGLAPCHATVTQAIGAAPDGATIEIFPGLYDEAVAIISRTGLALVGRAAAASEALTCEVDPATDRAELSGALSLDLHDGVRIENLVLHGGVSAQRGQGSAFIANKIARGLYLRMCYDMEIRHNKFTANARGGGAFLVADAAGGCVVADNAFGDGGLLFSADNNADNSEINGNIVARGDLVVAGERQRGNRVIDNRLYAGSLLLDGRQVDDAVVERNVISRGRLLVAGESGNGNRITGNQVMDSDGDGLELALLATSVNQVVGNTSRGHAGCDIKDVDVPGVDNHWSDNDFDTACGGADG